MGTSFNYLGRVISAADNDCPALVRTLANTRAVKQGLTRIVIREGGTLWVSGFFFKVVVRSVFFLGA